MASSINFIWIRNQAGNPEKACLFQCFRHCGQRNDAAILATRIAGKRNTALCLQ
jgi:hypothetical protein